MGKVDMGFVREMGRRATQACIEQFDAIEADLVQGGLIDPNRRLSANPERPAAPPCARA